MGLCATPGCKRDSSSGEDYCENCHMEAEQRRADSMCDKPEHTKEKRAEVWVGLHKKDDMYVVGFAPPRKDSGYEDGWRVDANGTALRICAAMALRVFAELPEPGD